MIPFFNRLVGRDLPADGNRRPEGRTKAYKILIAASVGIILSGIGVSISNHFEFALNETESLPNWAFLVNKDAKSPHRGDYFVFVAPNNPYYPNGFRFTKEVVGVPGDVVTISDRRDFYINGKFVGHAKERSKKGDVAVMSDPGVIPADHYFMVTPHPDSLDSKYKMIGLIDASRLIGKATPVM